ncbi:effector-associated constant component EACC1 [Microbispora bryophytorum]|uniref:effector-associated constant component EACC1 n=1 Tax=Microbispora bryophytorum TaxID=1460882 RepID=UPI003712618D
MKAQIRVHAADVVSEIISLTNWLNSQRELQGRVRSVRRPLQPEELGGIIELLTVTLSSSGAGIALARALTAWLANRHSDVSITVTTDDGTVTVEAKRVSNPLPLLEKVLEQDVTRRPAVSDHAPGNTGGDEA